MCNKWPGNQILIAAGRWWTFWPVAWVGFWNFVGKCLVYFLLIKMQTMGPNIIRGSIACFGPNCFSPMVSCLLVPWLWWLARLPRQKKRSSSLFVWAGTERPGGCRLLDLAGSRLVQCGRVLVVVPCTLYKVVTTLYHCGCGLSTNVVCVPWWWLVEGPIARHQ